MGIVFSGAEGSLSDAEIIPSNYVRRFAECEKEKTALKQ